MASGKATAIGTISEVSPVKTDVANTDATVAKRYTTVALDYGLLTLDNGDRLRLYGTPGQRRFDFLWKILAHNALGLVMLSDNSRPDPLADLTVFLDGFADQLETLPCVIGVSRLSLHTTPSLDDYADLLAQRGFVLPVLAVDVRQREDVIGLIDLLLLQIEAGMDSPAARPQTPDDER